MNNSVLCSSRGKFEERVGGLGLELEVSFVWSQTYGHPTEGHLTNIYTEAKPQKVSWYSRDFAKYWRVSLISRYRSSGRMEELSIIWWGGGGEVSKLLDRWVIVYEQFVTRTNTIWRLKAFLKETNS